MANILKNFDAKKTGYFRFKIKEKKNERTIIEEN